MTFEQLQYFVEAYRLKSITLAADNLYVSRQTLSAMINKLEQEYDVILFSRSKNGIEPTKAGDVFYQAAQNMLLEKSVLEQNLQNYSMQKDLFEKKKDTIKIDLCESLLHIFGEELRQYLTELYPSVYFDVFSSSEKPIEGIYKDREITVTLIPEEEMKDYQKRIELPFVIKMVKKVPLYIWVSKNNDLNSIAALSYDVLKSNYFCTLKGVLNGPGMAEYLGYEVNKAGKYVNIELQTNFYDYVNEFNYYTTDIPLDHGDLVHQQLFGEATEITLRETKEKFLCVMIYNQDTAENFYTAIVDFLSM